MEETSNDVDQIRRQPRGSVGAAADQRAIAQSNSAEIADALSRYSAPEEVMTFPQYAELVPLGVRLGCLLPGFHIFKKLLSWHPHVMPVAIEILS